MRTFDTGELTRSTPLSSQDASNIYNGLDCCLTYEIWLHTQAEMDASPPNVQETYATAMRKVAPVLYMNTKGLLVDDIERQRSIRDTSRELGRLESWWDRMCEEVVGWRVNVKSPKQMNRLFYDVFGLKAVRKRNSQGGFSPTTNADAMERFTSYTYIAPFARMVLAQRELHKELGFLRTENDEDGRMRTSLNIAGTNTGRFSSSFAATGTGTNLQNVKNRLRRPFISDPGRIFINVDLEQADARGVGARIYTVFYESHGPEAAGAYLDACESGDLHTRVTAMTWRDLPWPEDRTDAKAMRAVADTIFRGEDTYRDMAKRLGHGTNYFGTPRTMAQHTKTEVPIIEDFQRRYFAAFPLIGNYDHDLTREDWHGWIFRQLRDVGFLDNLFGRRRHFFDRYKDPATLREAIAYDPQSSTGEFLDRGWLNLWDHRPDAWLHVPVHDSILFSLPYTQDLAGAVEECLDLLRVEIELPGGRAFSIPLEAKVGFNWADSSYNKKTGLWENEYGLRKWTGKEDRTQPRYGTRLRDLLDR